MSEETIFALSSGHLPSGVAVIRVSGPRVREVLMLLTGSVPDARRAVLRGICDASGLLLDRGLVLFFPGPFSFTGEDCCELHVHGGLAAVRAVTKALGGLDGLRMADAGEFTRRAFISGKIDLTQAEALSDLIAAETEAQRRLALGQSSGGQGRVYESWRQQIIHGRAMIEAELDFADETDIPGSVSETVWAGAARLAAEIEMNLSQAQAAEIIRNGLEVVIIGAPNAGKSSLINALAGRDVSIVTELPGTTRDLVEVRLDLGGYRINVVDTAGIRESPERIEGVGINRALARMDSADLVLLVEDMALAGSAPPVMSDIAILRVGLKSDLSQAGGDYDVAVSAMTGAGLNELCDAILRFVEPLAGSVADATPVRLRQMQELGRCVGHLHRAVEAAALPLELRAEELRLASDCLARLVGKIDVEDLLDVIFSQFCVGK